MLRRPCAQPSPPSTTPQSAEAPTPIFGAVFSHSVTETVIHPAHAHELRFETWNGHKAKISNSMRYGGGEFIPGRICAGIGRAVRFPPPSMPFGSPTKLMASMRSFLVRYVQLAPGTAALLVAFAVASWFHDCLPIAPVLYLLGSEKEAKLVLRLLSTLCRRSLLLADIDVAALRTLPEGLNVTLLLSQRDLSKRVRKFLLASVDRHFHAAQGNNNLETCGARAISTSVNSTGGDGVRVVLSPTVGPLPVLSDAEQLDLSLDFQSKLLRYREVYWRRIRDAKPSDDGLLHASRDEVHTWVAHF